MSSPNSRSLSRSQSLSRSPQRAASPRRQSQHGRSRPHIDSLSDVLAAPSNPQYAQQQNAASLQQPAAASSYRPLGPVGAPAGRVQAAAFLPPPTSPLARPYSPTTSPSITRHRLGSEASLSSLGSDEGLGSQQDDNDRDFDPGASVISEAANMFDPNLYLHAQEAWNHWSQDKQDTVDEETGTDNGHLPASESAFSHAEEVSERAGLMSSLLAQRKTYGALPPSESGFSHSSRFFRSEAGVTDRTGTGLSAIHHQAHPEHATMRDAMKTADIGGTPGSNLGLLLIAVSQLCYSLMNLFVTLLDEREGEQAPGRGPENPPITAFEIVFAECFIIWLGATGAMLLFGTPHVLLGPPGVRLLLLARGIFGFLSTLFLYISLQALSLSDATSITFLGPLATGAAAALVLGEPFTVRERVAGIGALVGVIMIARPTAIFGRAGEGDLPSSPGDTPPIEGDGSDENDSSRRLTGVVIALLGVISMSGAWVSLRSIGRSASTYHSIAYFALCSWVLSLAGMLALGQPLVWPSTVEAGALLVAVGLFSLLAQVFQTLGLQRETAGRAAMMSYLQIIFATTFQVLLLGTPLEPLSVAGSLLVLANGAWVASAKSATDGVAAH